MGYAHDVIEHGKKQFSNVNGVTINSNEVADVTQNMSTKFTHNIYKFIWKLWDQTARNGILTMYNKLTRFQGLYVGYEDTEALVDKLNSKLSELNPISEDELEKILDKWNQWL